MSSFVTEFKKHQKQERILTGSLVLLAVLAPVSFTWMMNQKMNWIVSTSVAATFSLAALWLHVIRNRIAGKLLVKYETLEIGSILTKKITPRNPKRYVVTNLGYNHFYLKCLKSGEQVLVSKHRVREDFDIAN